MKFLLGFLITFFSSVVVASDADQVSINEPFARASMQTNSAVFMTVLNAGNDSALVSARSPVAKVVELHTHREENGMMRMRQVEKIDLPAGQTVMLKPGGLHVMLIGLKQALEAGSEVSVTLAFADGSEKTLMAPVVNVMRGQGMSHGSGQMQGGSHAQGMKHGAGNGQGMGQQQGAGRNQIKGQGYQQCEGHGEGYAQGKGHGKKHGEGYEHGQGHGMKHGEGYEHGKGHGMKQGKGYEQCEGRGQMNQ